jgi:hypothetical protein
MTRDKDIRLYQGLSKSQGVQTVLFFGELPIDTGHRAVLFVATFNWKSMPDIAFWQAEQPFFE